jgi:hypothetical protein
MDTLAEPLPLLFTKAQTPPFRHGAPASTHPKTVGAVSDCLVDDCMVEVAVPLVEVDVALVNVKLVVELDTVEVVLVCVPVVVV